MGVRVPSPPLQPPECVSLTDVFSSSRGVAGNRTLAEQPLRRWNGRHRANCDQRPPNRASPRLVHSTGEEKTDARAEGSARSRNERNLRNSELDLTHIVPF